MKLEPVKYSDQRIEADRNYEDGQWELAKDSYCSLLEENPVDHHLFFKRGECLFNLGEYELAVDDFSKYIENEPYPFNKYVYYKKAESEYALDLFDEAIKDYTYYIEFGNLENTEAYYFRGDCYRFKGFYHLAIADYTYYLVSNSNDHDGYYHRGECYKKIGDSDKAISNFKITLELNPEHNKAKAALSKGSKPKSELEPENFPNEFVDSQTNDIPASDEPSLEIPKDTPSFLFNLLNKFTSNQRKNQIELKRYKKCVLDGNQGKDLHLADLQYICNLVYRVVQEEGPVHKDEIIERIRISYNKRNIRRGLRNQVEQAIEKVKRDLLKTMCSEEDKETIYSIFKSKPNHGDFLWSNIEQLFKEPTLPPNSDIRHYYINHLKVVVMASVDGKTGTYYKLDELCKKVSLVLGLANLGKRLKKIINDTVNELIKDEYLVMNQNYVYIPENIYVGEKFDQVDERFDQLNGIVDKEWEIYFSELESYKSEHGDTSVPYSFKTNDGKRLGKWCNDQIDRYHEGDLSQLHETKLEELGFNWMGK